MKRYPFASLEVLIVAAADDGSAAASRLVADVLGRSLQQVYRWRKIGVTADQADELATRVGLHPFEVWPELADDQIADMLAERAEYHRKWRRTKRGRASSRKASVKWRASSRDYAARYQRQWRANNRDRARELQRAYYERNRERILAAKRERYSTDTEHRTRVVEAQRERDRARTPAIRTRTSTQVLTSINGHCATDERDESVIRRSDDAAA